MNSPSTEDDIDAEKRDGDKRFWQLWAWEPITTFNFLLMVFTGFYAVISLLMYGIARDSLRTVQRAFVFVSPPQVVGLPEPGLPTPPAGTYGAVTIIAENGGSTPARNVQFWLSTCARTSELPSNFSYPLYITPKTEVIPPKGWARHGQNIPFSTLADISPKTMGGVAKKQLYVWGVIEYRDVFGGDHETQWCFYLRAYDWSSNGAFQPQFAICPTHNCADDDCPEEWGDDADPDECPNPTLQPSTGLSKPK